MDELLSTWDMPPEVLEKFKANGIDKTHLKCLITNELYLKELCPHIGHRLDLKKKIEEYLDSVALTESVDTDTPDSLSSNTINEQSNEVVLMDISFDLDAYLNLPSRSTLPEFDLKTILQSTPHGNSVLNYYKKYGCLNAQKRNIIVDILVKYHYTFIINNDIKPEEFNLLSAKIVTLFPTESVYTYYMKAVPTSKSSSGRYVPAKGKLVDKVRNLLYISGAKRRSTRNTTASELEINTDSTDDKETNDDVLWLQHNSEPWEQVIEKWKKTFDLRTKQNFQTVHDFIENWKILKDNKSETLILLDFERLYGEKSLNFFKNWEPFFSKLVVLRQSIVTNEYAKSLIESLEGIADKDKKLPVQIYLMGYLIPPKGRKSRKIKFSTTESIEGILVKTDKAGDIDNVIDKQRKKANTEGDTVQPYVLLQGSLENFSQLYIVIDDVKYHMASATKAFDLLFKLFHVFHAKYPRNAEHLHLVIQKKVYEINTVYDLVPPYIIDVLNL